MKSVPIRCAVAIAVAVGCAALGCGAGSPEESVRAFWDEVREDRLDRAAEYVTEEGRSLLDDGGMPAKIDKVLLGEMLRNESSAIVRTSMLTREDDVELNVVFHTHLALEDGEWRIDWIATRQELTRATFAAGMRMVGDAIGQGIEELGEALGHGAAEVRDAIRDALDDHGERL